MTDAEKDEAFLQRWSRRKRAQQDTDTALPADDTAASGMSAAETGETVDEAPLLTDADMPPIESLDAESDFSPFMSPGVSEALRNRALRKLFHLPAFNITDGLNDYDEDFTQFAALGDTVTHDMKRLLQRELERQEAADASTDTKSETNSPEDTTAQDGPAETDARPGETDEPDAPGKTD